MSRIALIHWNETEAEERAQRLRAAGFDAGVFPQNANAGLRMLRADPPDAVVIDLSRLPSQGRAVAAAMRESAATRRIPIVFLEGDPEKVELIRRQLPDAVYAAWRGVRGAIKRAAANPPDVPARPMTRMEGYRTASLPNKLGIKEGAVLALINAPEDFEKTLGTLPDGVVVRRHARAACDIALWFVRSQAVLYRGIDRMSEYAGGGRLWIVWPKKTSSLASDLTQAVVRAAGLARGLVDYKVCAVDDIWTGLLFTRRKSR